MAKELESLDVTDSPELLRVAEEGAETGVSRVLHTAKGKLAGIRPLPKPRKRSPRPRPMTRDDPFYKLIGIASSGTESDASERKHEILAQAYRRNIE